MVIYSQAELGAKITSDCVPDLFINGTEPDASSSSESNKSLLTRRAQGSSLGAVGCLKYVEDFEILEVLGKGFFGVVYKVRDKRCNDYKSKSQSSVMVMKEPVFNNTQSSLCAKKIVSREYYMLRLLKHPNILKTRGVCIQQNGIEWNMRLLVDYCDGGSLQDVILNLQKSFCWLERLHVALDICKGMEFVHRHGFMHRDLTANNVLLQNSNERRKAVVADFGLSCRIPKATEMKQQMGTQNYMSPEMLCELYYNEKSDVYSFGIILCQMIARIDADHDAGLYRTSKFGLDYVRFAAHCPSDTPLNLLKTAFMSCLLAPASRPSFESLVEQIQQIINEDFPKGTDSFDESRLGRSYSDATIRNVKTPSMTTLNGRRSFRPDQLSIPEGVSVEETYASVPSETELDERIKQLAATVAECDPDYQESSLNPFANHVRYRSIRKIKPGDRCFIEHVDSLKNKYKERKVDEEPDGATKLLQVQRDRKRSVSMPTIALSSDRLNNNTSSLAKSSKRSLTLGLGEQCDLQGRMVATFREFDQNFTNISRSGILISSNDLSRLSNESLDKSFLPSEGTEKSDGEISDDIFDSASDQDSCSSNEPGHQHSLDVNQLCLSDAEVQMNNPIKKSDDSLFSSNEKETKVDDGRRLFRRLHGTDECRIL